MATGRAGSRIHSLQEPAYSRAPGRPACSYRLLARCHRDRFRGFAAVERGSPALAQREARQKAAVLIEIARERMIDRTGHMPRDGIDGFVLAGETVRAARVGQAQVGRAERALQRARVHQATGVRTRDEFARLPLAEGPSQWQAGGAPGREAAVEHGNARMPQPAEQPPRTGCKHAVALIVCNHLDA